MEIEPNIQDENDNINQIEKDEKEGEPIIDNNNYQEKQEENEGGDENEHQEDFQSEEKEGEEQIQNPDNLDENINQNIEQLNFITFEENVPKNEIKSNENDNKYNINNFLNIDINNNINNINDNKKYSKKISSKKDGILSNLLDKIKGIKEKRQQNINENLNNNNNSCSKLEKLDQELVLGLEKLSNNINNNINNEYSNNTNKDNQNKRIEFQIQNNPKLKEIFCMINDDNCTNQNNKNIQKIKGFNYGLGGTNDILKYFNTKNNIITSLKKRKNYNNDNNKYYVSCIDGKAIINGTRKDINIFNSKNILNNFRNHKIDMSISNDSSNHKRNIFAMNKYQFNKLENKLENNLYNLSDLKYFKTNGKYMDSSRKNKQINIDKYFNTNDSKNSIKDSDFNNINKSKEKTTNFDFNIKMSNVLPIRQYKCKLNKDYYNNELSKLDSLFKNDYKL